MAIEYQEDSQAENDDTNDAEQDRGQVTVPQEYSKNIISNVTKNEEARHGPVRVPRGAHLYIKGCLPSI